RENHAQCIPWRPEAATSLVHRHVPPVQPDRLNEKQAGRIRFVEEHRLERPPRVLLLQEQVDRLRVSKLHRRERTHARSVLRSGGRGYCPKQPSPTASEDDKPGHGTRTLSARYRNSQPPERRDGCEGDGRTLARRRTRAVRASRRRRPEAV